MVTLLILTSLVIIVTLEQQEVSKLYGVLWYDDPRELVNHFTFGTEMCFVCNWCLLLLSLFCNALHSVGAFHLHALCITENWGLVTLWCGKRLATAAINLFGNLGDYRVHWNSLPKAAACSLVKGRVGVRKEGLLWANYRAVLLAKGGIGLADLGVPSDLLNSVFVGIPFSSGTCKFLLCLLPLIWRWTWANLVGFKESLQSYTCEFYCLIETFFPLLRSKNCTLFRFELL